LQEPSWIIKKTVLAIHNLQLSEHGGSAGIRDEGLLDSALGKPHHVFAYDDSADIFRLAASYAFGIAKNHPFVDGNKRTALAVSITFLDINGWDVTASREDEYFTFLGLAEGTVSEEQLAAWFRSHTERL
jgi:death-on-curing protein